MEPKGPGCLVDVYEGVSRVGRHTHMRVKRVSNSFRVHVYELIKIALLPPTHTRNPVFTHELMSMFCFTEYQDPT